METKDLKKSENIILLYNNDLFAPLGNNFKKSQLSLDNTLTGSNYIYSNMFEKGSTAYKSLKNNSKLHNLHGIYKSFVQAKRLSSLDTLQYAINDCIKIENFRKALLDIPLDKNKIVFDDSYNYLDSDFKDKYSTLIINTKNDLLKQKLEEKKGIEQNILEDNIEKIYKIYITVTNKIKSGDNLDYFLDKKFQPKDYDYILENLNKIDYLQNSILKPENLDKIPNRQQILSIYKSNDLIMDELNNPSNNLVLKIIKLKEYENFKIQRQLLRNKAILYLFLKNILTEDYVFEKDSENTIDNQRELISYYQKNYIAEYNNIKDRIKTLYENNKLDTVVTQEIETFLEKFPELPPSLDDLPIMSDNETLSLNEDDVDANVVQDDADESKHDVESVYNSSIKSSTEGSQVGETTMYNLYNIDYMTSDNTLSPTKVKETESDKNIMFVEKEYLLEEDSPLNPIMVNDSYFIYLEELKFPTIYHYGIFLLFRNIYSDKSKLDIYRNILSIKISEISEINEINELKNFLSTKDITENLKQLEKQILDEKLKSNTDKLLAHKFKFESLQNLLLKTGNSKLIYNDRNDLILGSGTKEKKGEDYMGKRLMEIREKLQDEVEIVQSHINIDNISELLFGSNKSVTLSKWYKTRVIDIINTIYFTNNYIAKKFNKDVVNRIEDKNIKLTITNIYQPCSLLYKLSNTIKIHPDTRFLEDLTKLLNEKGIRIKSSSAKLIWNYIATILYFIISNTSNPTKQYIKDTIKLSENIVSKELEEEEQDNFSSREIFIVKSLINLLVRINNFNESMNYKNFNIDHQDIFLAIKIITTKDITTDDLKIIKNPSQENIKFINRLILDTDLSEKITKTKSDLTTVDIFGVSSKENNEKERNRKRQRFLKLLYKSTIYIHNQINIDDDQDNVLVNRLNFFGKTQE